MNINGFYEFNAYAPDQLISNNNPEMMAAADEPALPIDAEYIRVITRLFYYAM